LQPDDLFVDVGANVGLYTLLAIESGCDVIALEPAAEMADALRENLRLNGIALNAVSLLQVAAHNERATVHLVGPDANRRSVRTGSGEVPADRLDTLVAGRAVRGLKIDVEGNERLVLEGATSLLQQSSLELVQLEWNDASEAALGENRSMVAALLRGHGYTLFRPVPGSDAHCYAGDAVPGYGADVFAARGAAAQLFSASQVPER
jgi:FkbM family methyltransferase